MQQTQLFRLGLVLLFALAGGFQRRTAATVNGFLFGNLMQQYLNGVGNAKNAALNGFSHAFSENGLQPSLTEYDFIIVGSGPAGCVLANRLSERRDWNVLLLEAGKRENLVVQIPLMAAYFQSTDYNWGYLAEKQEGACFGMIDNICGMPRGRALGGTSVINYMIYNRGNPHDFDRWAAAGNVGWSYADVLPYFRKSESANLRGAAANSTYHGHRGPLSVEHVPYRSRLVRAFVDGSVQAGHRHNADYNGEHQVGVSYVQATTRRGRRDSAAHAFLRTDRPNLHVLTSARVTRILTDARTKTATGVEYVRQRRKHIVRARREVIVSAGTFNTPQLLQLSGIGPAGELARIGVPLVHDLPGVGQNMYDHMSHFGPTFIVNTTGQSLHVDQFGPVQMKQLLAGHGILTSIGGVEALNFVKTAQSPDPNPEVPDVELIFVPGSLASDEGTGLSAGMRLKRDVYEPVYGPLEKASSDHWSVMVMLFHPLSKGRVELKDRNPWHWPRLYANYFEHEQDVELLLAGIKAAIRIAETPAMQALGARLHDIPLPNCAHLGFGTDDYWRCSIRTLSCTLHHQVGTSKMGPASDGEAVVDERLRVYGVKRLRVADTSIIPMPPTSHTNAVSFMIGEKLADMLKEDWSGAGR